MLFLQHTTNLQYYYDANGNRTQTTLPNGQQINHLYYGSGHLHQINFDGQTLTDIERDSLHREIARTQGKLSSHYQLDPLGRLQKQIAAIESPVPNTQDKSSLSAAYAINRSYGYNKAGNLIHSTDQRSGVIHYDYDKLGRITRSGDETFAFDPAHNILSTLETQTGNNIARPTADNRIQEYNGILYYYDGLGRLIHRELPDGEIQNYHYDLKDQLIKVEIVKADGYKTIWSYTYDALGRRTAKQPFIETEGQLKALEESRTEFVWDGSHLIQESNGHNTHTYIYTHPESYEPLAQISHTSEGIQQINYFHCDQVGIPRELTDAEGNLVWFGQYSAWGYLKTENKLQEEAHQPFRLQNQYCDRETGLHYNFFRYYDPQCGRFISQDPIELEGGDNLYLFAPNAQGWVDWLGLAKKLTEGIVYRMGPATDSNLTPRPDKDTSSGLSTSLNKPNGKCQAIDVSKLKENGLEAINDHGKHVSIRPSGDMNFEKLIDWASTRKTDTIHVFTQAIKEAII